MGYLNQPEGSLSTRPGVLLIADQLAARRCVSMVLNDEYRIEEMESVEGALVAYTAFRPDLVIIDDNMPKLNGLMGIRLLREKSKTVPIICLSSNRNSEIRKDILEAGANVFLERPFSLLELTGLVYEAIHRYRKGL